MDGVPEEASCSKRARDSSPALPREAIVLVAAREPNMQAKKM